MTSALGRSLTERMAKQAAEKQTSGNYPAVPAIIDCVLQSAATGGKGEFVWGEWVHMHSHARTLPLSRSHARTHTPQRTRRRPPPSAAW